jgi:hypothetical protein
MFGMPKRELDFSYWLVIARVLPVLVYLSLREKRRRVEYVRGIAIVRLKLAEKRISVPFHHRPYFSSSATLVKR